MSSVNTKIWYRNCPGGCGKVLTYFHSGHYNDACKKNRKCNSCSSVETIQKRKENKVEFLSYKKRMSEKSIVRSKNKLYIEKMSIAVKQSLHKPDVRKRHLDALHHSQWLKVRTDKGQLELLEKWNRLGFEFQPNFQVKTDTDLFYIDGYDEVNSVVMEYDTKYHKKQEQKQKDEVRQQRIIDILKPRKFWRYDCVDKMWKVVL